FLRVLARRLGNEAEAEDVLQEAFLKFQAAERERDIDQPEAFLMRIALNLATDRSRQVRSRTERENRWGAVAFPQDAGLEPAAPLAEPDRALMAKQDLEALAGDLRELSPQVQRVFILHKVKGLSHIDTAERLGISRSTVESTSSKRCGI
ncbi:MAG: RNA polymerase sigma factor, partial [Pseudomonadota bacterium]